MAPPRQQRLKRNAPAPEESDDELNGAALEGILSDDEDEEADEDFSAPEDDGSDESSDPDIEDEDEDEDAESTAVGSESDMPQRMKDLNMEADDDKPNYKTVKAANGGERYIYDEIDPTYDSDDTDAGEATNTIGNIPLSFYDSYPHIGYDINGKKVMRPAIGDALDALLDSIEIPKGFTGLTDPQTGKPLNLSQDELELLRRLQMKEVPTDNYDPYPVRCNLLSTSQPALTDNSLAGNGSVLH